MEQPNQEISQNNQLTCEIDIKPEKDEEFNEILENNENTLTSELSIKYEPQEPITDDEITDYEPGESNIGVENRLIFTAGPDTTKKIAVRKLFLYKASVQCGACGHVATNWEEWRNHMLHHKTVAVPKNNNGKSEVPKRVRRSRVHYCIFCHRDILNFARHMFRRHSNETEIQKIKTLPPLNQQRKEMLSKLRKKGNFLCNSENPRAVRIPYKNMELLPCISCMGFYSAAYLIRHTKKCCRGLPGDRIPYRALAQNLLLKDVKVDPELKEKVFMMMRTDKISMVAKSDPIICECAAEFFRRSRNPRKTSLKMRELAKFLMCARNLEPSIKKMSDLLRTNHYWVIVRAIKILSTKEVYMDNVPIIVRNIMASLRECCDIAIKKMNIENPECSLTDPELQKDIRILKAYIQLNLKVDIIGQTANDDDTKTSQILINKQAGQTVFQHWTVEQKNIVISHFDTNLMIKVQPKKEDCIKLKELYPDLLKNTSWLNIQRLVKSYIFRKKINNNNNNNNGNNKIKTRVLIQWTPEQKKVANSFFKKHIDKGIPPRKYECVKLIQLHKDLFGNKNWRKIKVYVQNQYVKNSKAKTSPTGCREELSGVKPREDPILSNVSDDGRIIVENMNIDTSPRPEKEPVILGDGIADQASMFEAALLEEPAEARVSCDNVIITPSEVDSKKTDSSEDRIINRKMRFCRLCEAKVKNYARHLISSHRKQLKVRNYLYASIYDAKRNILLTKFRRKRKHLIKGQKARARDKKSNINKKIVLCRNCQGYFRHSLFREHKVQCKEPLKYSKSGQQNVLNTNKESHATPFFDAIRKSFDFYDSLDIKNIIQTIRLDETAVVGIGDVLICCYADQVFKKTTGTTVRHVVSNTIRELGKILIHLRATTNYDNLIDSLRPELYDCLFEATKKISGYNPESKTFQYSYLPVKMGKVLKDICRMAIKMIQKDGVMFELKDKDQMEKNLGRLLTLIQHHWSSDLLKLETARCDEPVVSSESSLSGEESDDDKLAEPAYDEGLKVPRIKFTEDEKKAIRSFFKKHIQRKQSPKKLEVLKFMSEHKSLFQSKNWVKIKAFVYNEYRLR